MNVPRFEIVQTDAGWHARSRAGNGEPVLFSEVYTERRAALDAIRVSAQQFSITPVYFDEIDGKLYVHAAGMRVEVRDVDERALDPAAACIYYQGCDEPRRACGYCPTHCKCGAGGE